MTIKTHEGRFEVEPQDGLFRYQVKSIFSGESRLVDLLEFNGVGCCSCEHFSIRCQPLLVLGADPKDPHRCKHLRAARIYLGLQLVETLIDKTVNQ